jgi:hypothetical protein
MDRGNTVDEDTRSISVPDYSGAGLAISVPVVLRARNAADARAIAGAQDMMPLPAQVLYPVGSSVVYLTLHRRFSLVFWSKLFTACSLS